MRFLAILILVAILVMISYQRAIPQQEIFVKDRQLHSASIQAYNQGYYQAAQDYLEQTSAPFQQDWNYTYVMGSIMMQQGYFQEADQFLQQTEEMAPHVLTMNEFLNMRGYVYIQLKMKAEAIEYLEHSYDAADTDEKKLQAEELLLQARAL